MHRSGRAQGGGKKAATMTQEFRDQYDPKLAIARLAKSAAQADPLTRVVLERSGPYFATFSDLPRFVQRRAWEKGIARRILEGR